MFAIKSSAFIAIYYCWGSDPKTHHFLSFQASVFLCTEFSFYQTESIDTINFTSLFFCLRNNFSTSEVFPPSFFSSFLLHFTHLYSTSRWQWDFFPLWISCFCLHCYLGHWQGTLCSLGPSQQRTGWVQGAGTRQILALGSSFVLFWKVRTLVFFSAAEEVWASSGKQPRQLLKRGGSRTDPCPYCPRSTMCTNSHIQRGWFTEGLTLDFTEFLRGLRILQLHLIHCVLSSSYRWTAVKSLPFPLPKMESVSYSSFAKEVLFCQYNGPWDVSGKSWKIQSQEKSLIQLHWLCIHFEWAITVSIKCLTQSNLTVSVQALC